MSSANINDSAAIQALLDQLKSSEAWQRVANPDTASLTAASVRTPHETTSAGSSSNDAPHASSLLHGAPQAGIGPSLPLPSEDEEPSGPPLPPPPSVAALLSQLQASSGLKTAAGPVRTPAPTNEQPAMCSSPCTGASVPGPDAAGPSNNTLPRAPHTPRPDLRACTFQQALPHLARLAEDRDFLKALTTMRAEQAELERQLCQERRDIQRTHEERVKAARTKASIIGAGLTQYEADALTDSFRAELLRFDRQRVLVAWDGLATKHQAALQALGVPAMFPSTHALDRERQEKIMQVLAGITGGHDAPAPVVVMEN